DVMRSGVGDHDVHQFGGFLLCEGDDALHGPGHAGLLRLGFPASLSVTCAGMSSPSPGGRPGRGSAHSLGGSVPGSGNGRRTLAGFPPRMVRGARAPARTPEHSRTKANPVSETSPAPGGPTIDEPTITAAVDAALAAIAAATDTAALKQVRVEHVGDASVLTSANRAIKDLPKEQKAAAGKLVGQGKGRVQKQLAARQAELAAAEEEAALAAETVDVTLPTDRRPRGAAHPLTTLQDRISDIFIGMGWEIAEGPEIEAEWFNFDALNFDIDHPARQMQDTFYVAPEGSGQVLRTHTSPVQARVLLERGV